MIAGQYDNGIEITCLVQVGRSGFLKNYQKKWKKRLTSTLKDV